MYEYLYISEIKDSSNKGQRKELGLFSYYKVGYLHYLGKGIMLLENGIGLVINVIANFRVTIKKSKIRTITNMLRKERKQNHIQCSIKTTKARKSMEGKNRNKKQWQ